DAQENLLQQRKELIAAQEYMSQRLAYANQQYRAANEQVSALHRRLAVATETAKAEEARGRQEAENLARTLQTRLDAANLKYKRLTQEEIPALKEKLEKQYSINRTLH